MLLGACVLCPEHNEDARLTAETFTCLLIPPGSSPRVYECMYFALCKFSEVFWQPVFRFRIRIRFVSWIRIRIQLPMKWAPKAKKNFISFRVIWLIWKKNLTFLNFRVQYKKAYFKSLYKHSGAVSWFHTQIGRYKYLFCLVKAWIRTGIRIRIPI